MSFFLRRLRRRFGDLASSLCCFQPPARISLPDAVRFSRLRAPRFVFIFGMSLDSCSFIGSSRTVGIRHRLAPPPRRGPHHSPPPPPRSPFHVLPLGAAPYVAYLP